MALLEDLLPRLKAFNPWILWGLMFASLVLVAVLRIIRRRRLLMALAPSFGLQPRVEAMSPLDWFRPSLIGAFAGQPVRLTVRQERYGRQPGHRAHVSLRLRVTPVLSAELQGKRERGVRRLMQSFSSLPVERVGDEALDQALDFNVLGVTDPEVLCLPEVRRTLIALVEASNVARFADGELHLRVRTLFNVGRVAETLLTRAQAFAAALTSDEARAVRAGGAGTTSLTA